MIRVTKTRFPANSNLLPFNKMSHGFKKWPSIFWNRHRLLAPIVKNSKIRVIDARKKINTLTGGVGYGRDSVVRNNLNLFEESFLNNHFEKNLRTHILTFSEVLK